MGMTWWGNVVHTLGLDFVTLREGEEGGEEFGLVGVGGHWNRAGGGGGLGVGKPAEISEEG